MKRILATLLAFCCCQSTFAQSAFPEEPDWRFTFYLWTTSLEGDLGIGENVADIDLSFSDILSELDLGAFMTFRRDWGDNLLWLDINWASLDPDAVPAPPNLGGSIDPELDLWIIDLLYGKKFGSPRDFWVVGAGGRYMVTDLTQVVTPPPVPGAPPPITISEDPDFLDFVVAVGKATPLGDKWDMYFTADYGTLGSDHSAQLQLIFQRQVRNNNYLTLGLRILDVDFDDQLSNGEAFLMDATMSGLIFGYTWD